MQNMSEDDLCQQVLIPLLRAMRYRDVTYVHGGSAEQGKDIVCWKEDVLGTRHNLAIVAKAVKMSGKAKVARGTAGEISTQIQQCFGEKFPDPITSEQQNVHECWVVSNKVITKEAEIAIRSSISPSTLERNVKFVNRDQLWACVEHYMPNSAIWDKLGDVSNTLGQLDTHYQPKVTLLPDSKFKFELVEKFPGAALEKPIEFSTKFQFPLTPEGKDAFEAVKRHFQTGEPVDIPLKYIQALEIPDFIKPLMDIDNSKDGVLHLGEAVSSPHLFVKIRIICEDGDMAEIGYVDLAVKWSGNQQITLVNQELGNPYKIELKLAYEQKQASITIKPKTGESENVFQLYHIYHLQNCLSKPSTIYLINRQNDFPLFVQSSNCLVSPVQAGILELLKDLITIQNKVKKQIDIPARDLSPDEIKSIAHLRHVLHKPLQPRAWDNFDIEIEPEGFKTIIETVKNSEDLVFKVSGEETEELFGVEIPMGKIEITYQHTKVENFDELVRYINEPFGETPISLRIIPSDKNSLMEIQYTDWIEK